MHAQPTTVPTLDLRGVAPRRRPSGLVWLAVVAGAFTLVQLVVVVPGTSLSWDEVVYVSQVSRFVPAAYFGEPRARGVSLLAAPPALLTSSVTVLQVWFSMLSGAALFGSMAVWRRLVPMRVLVVAAAAFASIWVTVLYGPETMPNLWSAFGALTATGCFLRVVRGGRDRWAAVGLAAAVAVVALMRPGDGLALVAPLTVAALVVRRWRRPTVFVLLAAGLVAGCAEWVVEAYVRFGGPMARLHNASDIQGGLGWHLAFRFHMLALDGRTLCRPCNVQWQHPATAMWWFALPFVAAAGIVIAVRAGRGAASGMAAATGLAMALPYLLTVDYAAPRFLLPAYALLALPVAECLLWPFGVRGRARVPLVGALALAVAAHVAVQFDVLYHASARSRANRVGLDRVVATLRGLGVRPPCVISGDTAVPVAFYGGCESRQVLGDFEGSITGSGLRLAGGREPVAVIVADGGPAPEYAAGWRRAALPDVSGFTDCVVYVSPAAVQRRA